MGKRVADMTPEEYERDKARQRAWREKNRDRARIASRAWREANSERFRSYRKSARKAHLDDHAIQAFFGRSGLKLSDVPLGIIKLKKQHLTIKRVLKKAKEALYG